MRTYANNRSDLLGSHKRALAIEERKILAIRIRYVSALATGRSLCLQASKIYSWSATGAHAHSSASVTLCDIPTLISPLGQPAILWTITEAFSSTTHIYKYE